MRLTSLKLNCFRNYADAVFEFSPRLNIIVGENAQGKTNLIESIFFLSRGYSHRAAVKGDLATFGQPAFAIVGEVEKENVRHKIGVRWSEKKKQMMADGKKESKQEVLGAICGVILFEPEDLRIVKAGPEKRRRFLNEEISGFLPGYYYALKHYQKVLKQRNALLKNIKYDNTLRIMLEDWDAQLANYGAKIMAYRIDYLKKLKKNAAKLHALMSDGREELTLYYQNNVLEDMSGIHSARDIAAVFLEKLKSDPERDIEHGNTAYGPHLDDIVIAVNGKDARKYASQGQQRTAAIALKLSQIEIYKEATGDVPIVLLDDVLSELDDQRQQGILKLLGDTQTFITCTDDEFARKYKDAFGQIEMKRFRVHAGKVL